MISLALFYFSKLSFSGSFNVKAIVNVTKESQNIVTGISLQNVKNPEVLSAQSNNISDFTALISKSMMTMKSMANVF